MHPAHVNARACLCWHTHAHAQCHGTQVRGHTGHVCRVLHAGHMHRARARAGAPHVRWGTQTRLGPRLPSLTHPFCCSFFTRSPHPLNTSPAFTLTLSLPQLLFTPSLTCPAALRPHSTRSPFVGAIPNFIDATNALTSVDIPVIVQPCSRSWHVHLGTAVSQLGGIALLVKRQLHGWPFASAGAPGDEFAMIFDEPHGKLARPSRSVAPTPA